MEKCARYSSSVRFYLGNGWTTIWFTITEINWLSPEFTALKRKSLYPSNDSNSKSSIQFNKCTSIFVRNDTPAELNDFSKGFLQIPIRIEMMHFNSLPCNLMSMSITKRHFGPRFYQKTKRRSYILTRTILHSIHIELTSMTCYMSFPWRVVNGNG